MSVSTCSHPGCKTLTGNGKCALHQKTAWGKPKLQTLKPRVPVLNDRRVPTMVHGSWRTDNMTSGQRGYDYAWQKRRAAQLRQHPLCVTCAARGLITPATVADHIVPHRGNPVLFAGALQSLCATCHSSDKQVEEQQKDA